MLEAALEGFASEAEKNHPIFQRSCRRQSWGLLVLNLLQWPCFFAAAVFVRDTQGKGGNARGGKPYITCFPVGGLQNKSWALNLMCFGAPTHPKIRPAGFAARVYPAGRAARGLRPVGRRLQICKSASPVTHMSHR